jgi:hypothetical protein
MHINCADSNHFWTTWIKVRITLLPAEMPAGPPFSDGASEKRKSRCHSACVRGYAAERDRAASRLPSLQKLAGSWTATAPRADVQTAGARAKKMLPAIQICQLVYGSVYSSRDQINREVLQSNVRLTLRRPRAPPHDCHWRIDDVYHLCCYLDQLKP